MQPRPKAGVFRSVVTQAPSGRKISESIFRPSGPRSLLTCRFPGLTAGATFLRPSGPIERRKSLLLGGGCGFWHVVAGSGASLIAAIANVDFDLAERTIHPGVTRAIADLVLGSEFVMNIDETTGEILDFQREEWLAAGFFGELLERFVATFLIFRSEERC